MNMFVSVEVLEEERSLCDEKGEKKLEQRCGKLDTYTSTTEGIGMSSLQKVP